MKSLGCWPNNTRPGKCYRPPLSTAAEVMEELGLRMGNYTFYRKTYEIKHRIVSGSRRMFDINDFKRAINSEAGVEVHKIHKQPVALPRRIPACECNQYAQAASLLDPGQSLLVPKAERTSLGSWLRNTLPDRDFAWRAQPEGDFKVFRLI